MVIKREATCPLCGGKLTPEQVLSACEDIADASAGVLACRCPFCQGHFDVKPQAGMLSIGYLQPAGFAAVIELPAQGLTALSDGKTCLVKFAERQWKFRE